MRVAMVSEHASPLAVLGGADAGGQNVYVAALATELGRRGIDVVVHTRRDDPSLACRVRMAPRVTVEHVDAGPARPIAKDRLLPYMAEFAEELAARWLAAPPDVVHSHFWMSGRAALDAAEPLGIPVVHTFHALGIVKRRHQGVKDTSPAERIGEERRILGCAASILATCTDELFELRRLGVDPRRVRVVPCGVNLRAFRPTGPAEPRRDGRHRLVVVSRLVERKGVGNVITALAEIPNAELVIAGGPERERLWSDPEVRRLARLARSRGVEDRVEFRGRLERADVPPLLRSADVVVTVPWYEPFGIVPLEAMACGVPVVASAVGGMIDTVVDDSTGLHVPPRDPERLAEVLGSLLGDRDRRQRLGRAGIQRTRRLYDWNRIAAATLDVYARMPRRRSRTERAGTSGRFRLPPRPSEHLAALIDSLHRLEAEVEVLAGWGERLASRLLDGGRLLAVGNGGSAAQAQHLTAELVGRYETEREPLSAICLHGDTSSLTAICNDYGVEEVFARQVRAHGNAGDVLIALSTSGRSANVLAAVRAGRERGLETWALTGAAPNPLADLVHEAVALDCASTATVQELHQVALHLICGAVDREVGLRRQVEAFA
jgi:glycosyltransferase involved in cell wall biosynthesis/phosphoheptose isomerase